MCLTKALNLKGRKYNYTQKKFWKAVRYCLRYNIIESPIYSNHVWKPGVNCCDKVIENKYIVDNSIHVFTNKKYAEKFSSRNTCTTIIPVYADAEDLVAYGKYGHAAFSKVFLKKEDYDKAMKLCES